VVASAVLIVTSPVIAVTALAIKLDSSGPVFFRQTRAGRQGRPFMMIKFRTMQVGAHTSGAGGRLKVDAPIDRSDPAITRTGRALRAASLDELPQMINILRGDMSLVGPRPTIPEQAAAYTPRERARLSVPPGLTGLAQVRGRNTLSWPERIEIDLEYVRRRSLALDLLILLRTPLAVLDVGKTYTR